MSSAFQLYAVSIGSVCCSCTKNASLSSSAAGTCSSSFIPSSSATTPKRAGNLRAKPSRSTATSCVSSTAASRAAVPSGTRSAIASTTTPPSACASTPWCAMGRPALSVAPKSSPPSNAASLMFIGMRRCGVPAGNSFLSSANHSSRDGPADARKATPPKPPGSTANNAATRFTYAPISSATARSTRTVDPESSSGLRRKRWRNAGPAMRLKCASVMAASPSKAA